MGGSELAGDVGDVGLGDVGEAGGLNLLTGGDFVFAREPAAAWVFGAVGAQTGLRPDDFGVDGFGEIDDGRKFGKREVGIDDVGEVGRMADVFLYKLIVAPFVEKEIASSRTTLGEYGKAGVDEGLGNVAGGPVDDEDGASVPEDFGAVHNGRG